MKKTKILIVGYGRLGQSFYRMYHSRYEIRGIKRTPLPNDPCPLFLMPIQSPAILPHLQWTDVLIFCPAPDKPVEGRRNRHRDNDREVDPYRKTYPENMEFLIDLIRRHGVTVQSFILIGSTGVYPHSQDGPWTEERTIPVETPRQEMLVRTERLLIESGIPYVILRCGGLYGEGRENFAHLLRKTHLLTSEMNEDRIALVHQEDVCGVIDGVIRQNIRNETFNVVDDSGLRRKELYQWAAQQAGMSIVDDGPPPPPPADRTLSNAKLKEILGYRFRSPQIRSRIGAWI
jgi:nucleoside-diphosphate-sugar epimerase